MTVPELFRPRTDLERLACYGSEPITVRGWWPEVPASNSGRPCGGGENTPSGWLYCDSLRSVRLEESPTESYGWWLAIDPTSGVTMPDRGQWVQITAHLDDPAAQGCDESAAAAGRPTEPEQAVLTCRGHVVVDSVRVVSGP